MPGLEKAARMTGAKICAVAGCQEPLPKGGAYRWCTTHEASEYERVMGRKPRRMRGTPMPTRSAPSEKRLPKLESKVLWAVARGIATTAAITQDVGAAIRSVGVALRWLEHDRKIERTSPGVYRMVDAKAR